MPRKAFRSLAPVWFTIGLFGVVGMCLVALGVKEIVQQRAVLGRYAPQVYVGQEAALQGIGHIIIGMVPFVLAGWCAMRLRRPTK